jgi:hypothetical protein
LKLSTGDVLLIRLPVQNLNALATDRSFRVLDIIETRVIDLRKVFTALAIFVVALGVAMTGLVSIAVAAMMGAVAVFVTGCITPEVAYRNIEWKTLILIGSMLAFGQAMQATGTANFLADLIIRLPFSQSPYGLLTLFFFLAMLLTQPMSNQSAAAVLVPIVMQTAVLLGFDPRPVRHHDCIGGKHFLHHPIAPACVLVYGAGHYKFMDFIRVGWDSQLVGVWGCHPACADDLAHLATFPPSQWGDMPLHYIEMFKVEELMTEIDYETCKQLTLDYLEQATLRQLPIQSQIIGHEDYHLLTRKQW